MLVSVIRYNRGKWDVYERTRDSRKHETVFRLVEAEVPTVAEAFNRPGIKFLSGRNEAGGIPQQPECDARAYRCCGGTYEARGRGCTIAPRLNEGILQKLREIPPDATDILRTVPLIMAIDDPFQDD